MTPTRTYLFAAVMVLLVVATAAVAGYIWWQLGDVEMSAMGIVAMVGGVAVALGLGIGLMWLVFHSHKRGYDDDVR
jgi:hypothetical protein